MSSTQNFFDSRWVTAPEALTVSEHLPLGFKYVGIAAGIKKSGKRDLALIVSDAKKLTSAAVFTRSGAAAPPVKLCRERCDLTQLRAVVVNSGNANAATGQRGENDAFAMQKVTADQLGLEYQSVAVCSTGVIGVYLPIELVGGGIEVAVTQLSEDYVAQAAVTEAIETTDEFSKNITAELELSGGTVRIAAQAKGAGMIRPNFATMLCFIQTDLLLTTDQADSCLRSAVDQSFDRITVDGQLSTNDTVILQASGTSGIELVTDDDKEVFKQALNALLKQLAMLIVRDGEGAKRVAKVTVAAATEQLAESVARAVADSPLVKAALHGGDPNWGRIAQAVGQQLLDQAGSFAIEIEGFKVCQDGIAWDYNEAEVAAAVAGSEVEYFIKVADGGVEATVYFSDLSHQYVTINAEYRT